MGVVKRRQPKKVITFQRRWLKRSSDFFKKKIGWRPSVDAPGDTNPSDATVAIFWEDDDGGGGGGRSPSVVKYKAYVYAAGIDFYSNFPHFRVSIAIPISGS